MSGFEGNWKLVESENFDEYMKEVNVGLLTRKAAATLKPSMEVTISGDKWTMSQKSTFKNSVLEFTLNQEFDETTPDGRTLKSIVTFADGKLHHVQKAIKSGDKDSTIERWIEGNKLITTLTSGSVVCRRTYDRA